MRPSTKISQETILLKEDKSNADSTLVEEIPQKEIQIEYVAKIPEKEQAKEDICYLKRPEKSRNEKATTIAFIWCDELVQFEILDLLDQNETKLYISEIQNCLSLLKAIPFCLKGDNDSIKTGSYIEYSLRPSWIEFTLIEPLDMQKSFSQSQNASPQRAASLINTPPNPKELTESLKIQIKTKIAQEEYNSKCLTSSARVLEDSYSTEEYKISSYFYGMPTLFGLLAGLAVGFANQSTITSTAMTAALTSAKITAFAVGVSLPYLGIALGGLALITWAIIYCKRNNIGLKDIANGFVEIIKKCLCCFGRERDETKNSNSIFSNNNANKDNSRNNQLLNQGQEKFPSGC